MKISNSQVQFEVDTGCGVTILSKAQYNRVKKNMPKLRKSKVRLKTQNGGKLKVEGMLPVSVTYKEITKKLPVTVVSGSGPNLVGCLWIEELTVDIQPVHKVEEFSPTELMHVLSTQEYVFKDELGTLKGVEAVIHVNPQANPRFYKPRSVPYVVKPLVDAELDKLLEDKIIEPVMHSERAAPIMPVLKPSDPGTGNRKVRICGDYKFTVNQVSSIEQCPISKVEDLQIWQKERLFLN